MEFTANSVVIANQSKYQIDVPVVEMLGVVQTDM